MELPIVRHRAPSLPHYFEEIIWIALFFGCHRQICSNSSSEHWIYFLPPSTSLLICQQWMTPHRCWTSRITQTHAAIRSESSTGVCESEMEAWWKGVGRQGMVIVGKGNDVVNWGGKRGDQHYCKGTKESVQIPRTSTLLFNGSMVL